MSQQTERMFSIGQMAQFFGINKMRLIRFEQEGLFIPTYKTKNGSRYYDIQKTIELSEIFLLKGFGFSHKEIINHMTDSGNYFELLELMDAKINAMEAYRKRLNMLVRKDENEMPYLHFYADTVCYKKTVMIGQGDRINNDIFTKMYMELLEDGYSIDVRKSPTIRTHCNNIREYEELVKKSFLAYDLLIPIVEKDLNGENENVQVISAYYGLTYEDYAYPSDYFTSINKLKEYAIEKNLIQTGPVMVICHVSKAINSRLSPKNNLVSYILPIQKPSDCIDS